MPTEIPVFDSPNRCLWLSRTPKGLTLQLQDDIWLSDVFAVTEAAVRALSVGFQDLDVSNDSGHLRLRWAGDRLMLRVRGRQPCQGRRSGRRCTAGRDRRRV